MRPYGMYIWILSSLLAVKLSQAQPLNLPKLSPSYSEDFSNYSSFPSMCLEDVYMDKNGRFWLQVCSGTSKTTGLYLFQFDGYQFKLIQGPLEVLGTNAKMAGIYGKQKLVGTVKQKDHNQLFFFDVETHDLKLHSLDFSGNLLNVDLSDEDRIFLTFQKDDLISLCEWKNGELQLQTQFREPSFLIAKKPPVFNIHYHDEKVVWASLLPTRELIQVDKETAVVKKIPFADFEALTPKSNFKTLAFRINPGIKIIPHSSGFYLSLRFIDSGNFFKWDSTSDQFLPVEWLPSFDRGIDVFQDLKNNLLFVFKNKEDKYQAILQDPSGKRFDYSDFLKDASSNPKLELFSHDFKIELINYTFGNFSLYATKASEAIQHFLPKNSIRAMAELSDERFLVKTEVHSFIVDGKTNFTTEFKHPDFKIGVAKLLRTESGHIWTFYRNNIVQCDTLLKNCIKYPAISGNIRLFTFIGENKVAIIGQGQKLFTYDLATGTTIPLLENGKMKQFPGYIHDIFYSKSEIIWLATTAGLWKIDPKVMKASRIGSQVPFKSGRFLCIQEDEKGRLWLGTPLHGLYIYDPISNELENLNNKDGLSNNTVASILIDEEGIRWLGTYNGISLVSRDGKIITNIYEEDGLIHKENNRYATLKANNGKLLIGTVKGLNYIDPVKIKERIGKTEKLKIYLNTLSYFDQERGKDTLRAYDLNHLETIQLPASKRFLKLSFALSNYFKPKENQYAYQLQGINEDWVSLGSQNSLSLNSLPSGKYRLLLKGSDRLGNETAEPLIIDIHAKAFFYYQPWFYLLCLAILGGGALLWITRLRFLVRKATQKIEEDKTIIEQQAEKLRELDKAKSRFFTNISHEFRTPLTIIYGMADQVKSKPDIWLDKGMAMIKKNTANLLNLINQILDLRKLESNALQLHLIQANIIPYLKYISESFQSYAQNKDLKIHFLTEHQAILMDYDPDKIMQIVSNLLSNAIKFTPEGGNIYVTVRLQESGGRGQALTERSRSQGRGAGSGERGARGGERSAEHQKSGNQPPQTTSHELPADFDSAQPASSPITHHSSFSRQRLAAGEALILQIKDTGIGISEDQLGHVFDRFYQVEPNGYQSDNKQGEGTGIGLALSKELVKLMKGTIDVRSKLGEGSIFSIILPISNNAAVTDFPAHPHTAIEKNHAIESSEKRNISSAPLATANASLPMLLIVEDNPDVAAFLIACLQESYQLQLAQNGQEGIDKAIEQVPDLIISDVMMPIKDGFELCATLKQDERTSHIPIILLTAKVDQHSKIGGLKRGADAYLTKPFEREELMVRLEKLLELRKKLQLRYAQVNSSVFHQSQSYELNQEDAFILRVHEIIQNNMEDEDFGTIALCNKLQMSRTQVHNKMKALTGKSTSLFIRSARLLKAKDLLQNSDLNISEIGYEVGFASPAYFSRVFREEFGVSPKVIRN